MPTETEIAWFAGLLDGEGYIQIEKWSKVKYYRLTIRISMLHLPTLQKVQTIWGAGVIRLVPSTSRKYKPFWRWHLHGPRAAKILQSCLPYLVTKKAEAEIAIAFQNQLRGRKRSNQYTGAFDHSIDAEYKRLIEETRRQSKQLAT